MPAPEVNRRLWGATAAGAAAGAVLLLLPEAPVLGEAQGGALAQATAVSPQETPVSPQRTPVSPQPQPTPGPRPVRFFPVAPPFQAYYALVNGPVVMGQAISPLAAVGGLPAQYFEKARLEDHRTTNTTGNPAYDFEYGLLVDEMAAANSTQPVGGDASSVTYATVNQLSSPALRVPAPAGFTGGTATQPNGSTFIPFSATLAPGPGQNVPPFFWEYMLRPDLFPGGWLHDIGLPLTAAVPAVVNKGRFIAGQVIFFTNVPITVQAFQRTILTYDPANPEGFLVERANSGTDYMAVFPERVPQ